jgi:dTDP-4-dehydrorhamnose reductase
VVGTIEGITDASDRPILILGAFGMLGHALQEVFPRAVFRGKDLDITDQSGIRSFLLDLRPAIVINAAAYTDVEGCEDRPDYAFLVNGTAPGYIASACRQIDAILVHYSTDYVFDGSRPSYTEKDTPHPINVYGASKLRGEERVQAELEDHIIIRTSWLFGPHGRNFVDTMLQLSQSQKEVRVVNDQFGRPTFTQDLAKATAWVAAGDPGIYHITNDGTCSWYEFARTIIPNAAPCTTDEFPRKARRPKYSILENTRTPPLRSWHEALSDYLKTKGRDVLV